MDIGDSSAECLPNGATRRRITNRAKAPSAPLREHCVHHALLQAVFPHSNSRLDRRLSMYNRLKWLGPVIYGDSHSGTPRDTLVGSGGAFNVEFSPMGNYLVAVFENGRAAIVNPASRRCRIDFGAHDYCANCVCFINNKTFATCSDDKSVKVWDARSLTSPIYACSNLHNYWVKNIQYDATSHSLLSSGFDRTVRLWSLNSSDADQAEEITPENHLRVEEFLMRMKLSPDCRTLCLACHRLPRSESSDSSDEDADNLLSVCRLVFYRDVRLADGGLKLSGASREVITTWPEGGMYITSMQVLADSEHILTRVCGPGQQEYLCVHSLATGELLYQIRESHLADGMIKEPGVSSDGRAICSPFGMWVRILGFDSRFSEVGEAPPGSGESLPRPLYEVVSVQRSCKHPATVLTCRFSPTQMLVAAGDSAGNVFFAQPKL